MPDDLKDNNYLFEYMYIKELAPKLM